MQRIVMANWKAHLTPDQSVAWLTRFMAVYDPKPGVEVVLAVSDLCMCRIHPEIRDVDGIFLAAQGVSPYPPGSYTGATPAAWLKEMAKYVLVGHQERRRYFHENIQDIAAQVRECVAVGLCPVICVDHAVAVAQVAALDSSVLEQSLFAYTPKEAVSPEVAAGLAEIEKQVRFVASLTGNRPVLYGGGVKADNAAAILGLAGVGGILVGSGCLDPVEFDAIVRA